MENTNPYEKKYKQMSMLGKGNYGNTDNTQEKSIKYDSTMEKKEKMPPILSQKKCFSKDSQKKTSSQPMDKYLLQKLDSNFGTLEWRNQKK